jgi:hypothetical protein
MARSLPKLARELLLKIIASWVGGAMLAAGVLSLVAVDPASFFL